jgi:hypothetical protein
MYVREPVLIFCFNERNSETDSQAIMNFSIDVKFWEITSRVKAGKKSDFKTVIMHGSDNHNENKVRFVIKLWPRSGQSTSVTFSKILM